MRRDFDQIARRQHSLVTSAQLEALGWSRSAVRRAIASGRLRTVRPGVYRPAGAPLTHDQALLAAVLAAKGTAVVSHGTAARLWGWSAVPDPEAIDLLSEGCLRSRLPGVRGHTTGSLPIQHRTVLRSIPVTTAARTLVDACGLVGLGALEEALEHGLRQRLVTLPKLVRAVEEVPRSGRRRVTPIMQLLGDRVPGYSPSASPPELDLVKVLLNGGFDRPELNIRVDFEGRTNFVDVGWRAMRVGYEYDSESFHAGTAAFHNDRARLRRLKRAGWDIWPVTSRTTADEVLAIAALVFGAFRHGRAG